MIEFESNICRNLESARTREWLVTNGIGGYASSTVPGMNTRRYHGLLIAATRPPLGRILMLSRFEETLVIDGKRFDLSTSLYAGGFVHPSGYLNLVRFRLEPYPTFTYAPAGDPEGDPNSWELEKSIFMVQGENSTVIEYQLKRALPAWSVSLEVRPLIAFRDYHGTSHENDALNRWVAQTPDRVELLPYHDLPSMYLAHDPAEVHVDGLWYKNFEYEIEHERGLDHVEDLFSPLVFKASLNGDQHGEHRFSLIASTEPRSTKQIPEYREAELARQAAAAYSGSGLVQTLYRAAEQFIATRKPHMTILAGYHWFGDWGRDTMIALPGLLLTTGKPEIAGEILLEFVRYVDGGMLPNRFPDEGDEPEYNTVDATLWFFEAIRQYLAYSEDAAWRTDALALIREHLYAPLQSIIAAHVAGTRYNIHVDDEGFLWAGDANSQLTWMDAKIGDTAFTPRSGRPVEIQALWFNALRTIEDFARLLGDDASAVSYAGLADKLQKNFESVFWRDEYGYLCDTVGEHGCDASLRPNQAIAISLHYPLLKGPRAVRALEMVERELLTPYGLRTLSPNDSRYRAHYQGGVWDRDSSYHQGTVWPWLAGPFFFAKLNAYGPTPELIAQIRAWLEVFSGHLREAGLGQVSEIFDADPPYTPRGCMAQAWSVSEILRLAKHVEAMP
jgi:predicted glycogen debranching enzyme